MKSLPSRPTDLELIERWRGRSGPLLPLLHEFHARDGHLSESALSAVSGGLKIPIAELYGTVTFYHHFAREPGGHARPRVCTGPVCALRGAEGVITELRARDERPTAMACPGRCDLPVPVLRGDSVFEGRPGTGLDPSPSPLPPPPVEGVTECVFAEIRRPGRATLAGYRESGGYRALERVGSGMSGDEIIAAVDSSGLAGRGGAGFPTGRKWRAVADAPGHPKSVICNADEGEPGCFKDRALLDLDPHAVIEGMAIAARATGALIGIIYLRYEYPDTLGTLERALEEAREAGYLSRAPVVDSPAGDAGPAGSGGFNIEVRRGAGAYICGEETSMLNSIEGKRPFPRERPPFPVTHGYNDLPTVVNNVETLASVPPILARSDGAAWYRALGRAGNAGTKVISLSGDIRRPGNYEIPLGYPLARLLEEAGGPPAGRSFQAATMAGLSGGFLSRDEIEEVTLDEPSIRAKGSFLGAGGIMLFDDSRDMIEVTRGAMEFFAEESCGKCFPCRIGTVRLVERLSDDGPDDVAAWLEEVDDLNRTMKETSACGLGQAAPLLTESLVRKFPERVEVHVAGGPGAIGGES